MPATPRPLPALAVAVALGALTACSSAVPGSGPTTSASGSTAPAVVEQYRSAESVVVFSPRPDGSVVVEQTTVVDAGSGQGVRALSVAVPTRLRVTRSDQGAWFVAPAVTGATARETTDGERVLQTALVPDGDLVRITVQRDDGWPAGRHRVVLRFTLSGTWTALGGRSLLVLPDAVLGAGWYVPEQRAAATFRASGGQLLQCAGDNPAYTSRPCERRDGAVLDGDVDSGGSTSADNTYLTLSDPAGVTAPPVPAQLEEG